MTTDEEIINEFNVFIKKWCGNMYAHLIDTDDNDGQVFREHLSESIKTARADERRRIAKEWEKYKSQLFMFTLFCPKSINIIKEFEKELLGDEKYVSIEEQINKQLDKCEKLGVFDTKEEKG